MRYQNPQESTTTAEQASEEHNATPEERHLLSVLATLDVLSNSDQPSGTAGVEISPQSAGTNPFTRTASPLLKTNFNEDGSVTGGKVPSPALHPAHPEPESPGGETMSREEAAWTFMGDDPREGAETSPSNTLEPVEPPPTPEGIQVPTLPQGSTAVMGQYPQHPIPLPASAQGRFHVQPSGAPSPAQLLQQHHSHLPQYQQLSPPTSTLPGGARSMRQTKGHAHQQGLRLPHGGQEHGTQQQPAGTYRTEIMNARMLQAGCRRLPVQFNQQHHAGSAQEAMVVAGMMNQLRANAAQTNLMYPQPPQLQPDGGRDGSQAPKVIHLTGQSVPGVVEVDALAPTLELFIGQLPYHCDLLSIVMMVNRVVGSIFSMGADAKDALEVNVVTRIKQGPKPTCAFVEVAQPYAKILLRQSKRILCDPDAVWVATPQPFDHGAESGGLPVSARFSDLLRHLPLGQPQSAADVADWPQSVAEVEGGGFAHFSISPAAVQALNETTVERSACQVKGIPHQAVVMEPATVRGTRQQQMANSRRAQQVVQAQQQHQIHGVYRHQQSASQPPRLGPAAPSYQSMQGSAELGFPLRGQVPYKPNDASPVLVHQQTPPLSSAGTGPPLFTLSSQQHQQQQGIRSDHGSSSSSSGSPKAQDSIRGGAFTVEGINSPQPAAAAPPPAMAAKNPFAMNNQETLTWLQPTPKPTNTPPTLHNATHLALMSAENLSKMVLSRAPAKAMSKCPCGATHVVSGVGATCVCVMCSRWLEKGNVVRRCPKCEEQVICPLCVATTTVPLNLPCQQDQDHSSPAVLPPPRLHLRVPPRTTGAESSEGGSSSGGTPFPSYFPATGGSLWE